MIEVRPAEPEDSAFARRTLEESWGGPHIAVHGELIDAFALPALFAWSGGERAGLLTYREDDARGWEIVTLDAVVRGAGGALIDALRALATGRGARRLWLVTTNDNTGRAALLPAALLRPGRRPQGRRHRLPPAEAVDPT